MTAFAKKKTLKPFLLVIIFVVPIIYLQISRYQALLLQDDRSNVLQKLESQSFQTRAQLQVWNALPGFGFENLVSDWVFLKFLQYFGDDKAREATSYRLSPDFFEVILKKDPYYVPHYLFLSTSSSIYAAEPERTVALMEAGLQHLMPGTPAHGYLVWRYKAIDELLFLGDAAAAEQSFRTAAEWAQQSNDPEAQAIAAMSERTAEFLANNPVSKRAQIDAWASILVTMSDEQVQRLAIERIEGLGGRVEVSQEGAVSIAYPEED